MGKPWAEAVRVIATANPVGLGGASEPLGRFAIPVGMGHVNGIVLFTVVKNDEVPPLTPISTLMLMGTVIDSPAQQMHFTTQGGAVSKLESLPSGHKVHNLVEFSKNGWPAPSEYAHFPSLRRSVCHTSDWEEKNL